MGPVIPQHPGKEQRIAVKPVSRHDQGHQRTPGCDEEGEAHDRPVLFQYRKGDQKHIDVAELQGQLAPPVEAAHFRGQNGVTAVPGHKHFVQHKTHQGQEAEDKQHRRLRLFTFPPQQQAEKNEQKDECAEYQKIQRIERTEYPAVQPRIPPLSSGFNRILTQNAGLRKRIHPCR